MFTRPLFYGLHLRLRDGRSLNESSLLLPVIRLLLCRHVLILDISFDFDPFPYLVILHDTLYSSTLVRRNSPTVQSSLDSFYSSHTPLATVMNPFLIRSLSSSFSSGTRPLVNESTLYSPSGHGGLVTSFLRYDHPSRPVVSITVLTYLLILSPVTLT